MSCFKAFYREVPPPDPLLQRGNRNTSFGLGGCNFFRGRMHDCTLLNLWPDLRPHRVLSKADASFLLNDSNLFITESVQLIHDAVNLSIRRINLPSERCLIMVRFRCRQLLMER